MDSSSLCNVLTFFFASLLLFLSAPSPANASTQLVESICKRTLSNSECLQALDSDHRTASVSKIQDLAQIALELAVQNAEDSKAFIENLLKSKGTEPIKECASSYNYVVMSFQSALQELKEDPLTANYDVKVASDGAYECESALSSQRVKIPEISSRNHLVELYSNIGFVITNQL